MLLKGAFRSFHLLQVAAIRHCQMRHHIVKLSLVRRETRKGCVHELCEVPEGLGILRREPKNRVASTTPMARA
jgi:hypothetical protein